MKRFPNSEAKIILFEEKNSEVIFDNITLKIGQGTEIEPNVNAVWIGERGKEIIFFCRCPKKDPPLTKEQ
ncbi:MAG: hypothetical protein ACFFC7_14375 [Candidatus Hermodarchaeota archaeon]